MRREFKLRQGVILFVLAALIVSDLILAVYTWNRASQETARQELATLQHNLALLKADIARAGKIQQEMPAIQKDCDQFEGSFFPAASGYSSVNAELTAIAAKSGLHLDNRSFRNVEVKGRPRLTEIQIDTSVTGDYRAIVSFLNGLQRSPNMYAVDGLTARSATQAQGNAKVVQVGLHIRTYFRAA